MTFSDFPLTLVWDITYQCNFKCKHCYICDGKHREDLPSNRLHEIIYELADCGVFYIDIGGGEPLLRKNDLIKLIKTATLADIECTVATNGWYLDRTTVKELNNAGLKRMLVSIDGSKSQIHDEFRSKKGAFKKAIRGIKNCIKSGIETYIISTLTMVNFNDIHNIINLAQEIGCDGIIIAKFVPFGSGDTNKKELIINPKDYEKKLDEISKLKKSIKISIKEDCGPTQSKIQDMCHAGKFLGGIRPNGDVVPCAFFPLIIGNISEHSFKEIWSKSKIINSLKREDYLTKVKGCEECEFLNICKGGCKGRSQTYYGDWLNKDPLCNQ